MRRQGFTLVELAIVLVIIGIILGMVLKGQELVFNAKMKRLQNQIKEMVAAFYTYYDQYQYYPGDDPYAPSRWDGAPEGNGDGQVTKGYCDKNGEESCILWRHLRYANIISGDPTIDDCEKVVPHHIFGGRIQMFTGCWKIGGTTRCGLWVALQSLTKKEAEALDRIMDDGQCDTGSIGAYDSGGNSQCNGHDYPDGKYVDVWINF